MILVLGGTKEANYLIKVLRDHGYELLVTTVSSYGAQLAENSGAKEILVGSLDESALTSLLKSKSIGAVIDATHPYAEAVTNMTWQVCRGLGILYLRHSRQLLNHDLTGGNLHWVDSYQEAAGVAFELGNVVMATTGSKNVSCFLKARGNTQRLVVRVLPEVASIIQCREAGCSPKDIVAMQGPFSAAMNKTLFQEYGVEVVVTKDSGNTGGVDTKLAAARELELPVVLIKRPAESAGRNYTVKEILTILKEDIKCH